MCTVGDLGIGNRHRIAMIMASTMKVTNLRQSRRLEIREPLKAVIYGAT
jgi:hypothetical protein